MQMGAKSLAAGATVGVALWAFKASASYFFGSSKEALTALVNTMPDIKKELEQMAENESVLIEAFARLLPFRRFRPRAFDEMCLAAYRAAEGLRKAYSSGGSAHGHLNATAAFRVRADYQQVIERVRVFRAILEKELPTALEDFDEVAVDINARVEQVCSDAIQDTFV